jgi:hypothetical protein
MNIEVITEFFGWCLVINAGLLVFTTVILLLAQNWAAKIHSKMFNLKEEDLKRAYFNYVALYKMLLIVFNLVPYVALKLMNLLKI